ncbi:hypothetical protein MKW94_015344 [Papaver nudicaule]|uniref:Uncharacterized protein n=1 Tax=Papaver nudicaule TaxID=74823 RepID=A0AA41SLC7_PAPNU|nr:hypothetical protein [Papaver nudicaule]
MEPVLFNLISEPAVIVCTEVLALINHHKPGVIAFRQENGYGALMEALGSDNARFGNSNPRTLSTVSLCK